MSKSSDCQSDASDLVMTQAELPPGIDAPTPQHERDRITSGPDVPPDVEREVRGLAERVGGLARLRELVGEMERGGR